MNDKHNQDFVCKVKSTSSIKLSVPIKLEAKKGKQEKDL